MLSKKTILFFATAFFLFAVDVGCTYTTFAVRGVPIEYEVNQVFRDWVIRDGWLMSIGKFTILKTLLFALAGWAIFRTRSRIAAFILAQCIVSNHLVAISSHPTLWWMDDLEYRSLLLKGIAGDVDGVDLLRHSFSPRDAPRFDARRRLHSGPACLPTELA